MKTPLLKFITILLITICVASAADQLEIPTKKLTDDCVLVGWSSTEAKHPGYQSSSYVETFEIKGPLAISAVLNQDNGRHVVGIVPQLARSETSNYGTSIVVGVWIIFEPQKNN